MKKRLWSFSRETSALRLLLTYCCNIAANICFEIFALKPWFLIASIRLEFRIILLQLNIFTLIMKCSISWANTSQTILFLFSLSSTCCVLNYKIPRWQKMFHIWEPKQFCSLKIKIKTCFVFFHFACSVFLNKCQVSLLLSHLKHTECFRFNWADSTRKMKHFKSFYDVIITIRACSNIIKNPVASINHNHKISRL